MLTARIAVIVSGGGTNLQALIDAQGRGELKSGSIALVIADKAGIGAVGRAEAAGIDCVPILRREPGFEEQVLTVLTDYNIDMVPGDPLRQLRSEISRPYHQHPPRTDPLLLRERLLWPAGPSGGTGLWREGDGGHRPLCQRGGRWRTDHRPEGGGRPPR